MVYRIACLVGGLVIGLSCLAKGEPDALLLELDYLLNNREPYIVIKKAKIDSLKRQLEDVSDSKEQFELNSKIFDQYRYYISDSALLYIKKNELLAKEANKLEWYIECQIQYSRILSSVGIFNEAQERLEHIPQQHLTDSLQLLLNMAYEELFVYQLEFIDDRSIRGKYDLELIRYRAAVMKLMPENSADYFFWMFKDLYMKGNYKEARLALEKSLQKVDTNSHLYAGVNYCMSLFFDENKGGMELEEKLRFLTIAAIADIKSTTKENAALFSLANVLQGLGDVNRAYKYVHFALDDANFYNARYRNLQIAKVLPIIENAYLREEQKQKNRLRMTLLIISLLSAGLIVSVIFLRKHALSLTKARNSLDKKNEELKAVVDKLNLANLSLSDANKIKETYIGYFLNLCSSYIEKIEDFQKIISKSSTLKKKGGFELQELTGTSQVIENELKVFYQSFDNAFLAIFPDFVEGFNKLMPEQEYIVPKQGEKLSTELRIFALIRLGIKDSHKIASLLRYSLTTIYTYRSRVKNKSVFHADFEEKVMQIGSNQA